MVERSEWNLWKFTQNFWKYEMPSFTNSLVNTLKNIITHCRWSPTSSLFIVNIGSPTHLWTVYTIVLQLFHSFHFGRKPPRTIRVGFPQHSCFSVKKAGNSANFKAGSLSIAGHITTHIVETRANTRRPVMWWFTRQWVMWRYLCMHELSPACTLVA
jgi:hypothetical protein